MKVIDPRKIIVAISISLLLIVNIVFGCSCGPPENNFFKNIHNQHSICLAVFERMDNGYSYEDLNAQTGYFLLIDKVGSFNSDIGDTIVVTGQDGLNCGAGLESFLKGDTVFLALTDGCYESFERDTFYLDGCSTFSLKLVNGMYANLDVDQIKSRISSILDNLDSRCDERCDELEVYNFYFNVHSDSRIVLAKFIDYKYSDNSLGISNQMGKFVLLDTLANVNSNIGDTIIIYGEDGINCGQMLSIFSGGDTLFLILEDENYSILPDKTYFLKGGLSGRYYKKSLVSGKNI